MKRKIISIAVVLGLMVGMLTIPAQAATEEEIEDAIVAGCAWLAADQNADGSWPPYSDWPDNVATTGLAVLKLEHRAYELGFESPFDPDYEYSGNVSAGLDYLFAGLLKIDISVQDHTGSASGTVDDPDTRDNDIGIYARGNPYPFDVYDTGIVLSAISASGTPDRVVNVAGSVVDGWKYLEVAQDMVDFLAWAQSDYDYAANGMGEGGWSYGALDNDDQSGFYGPDNSNGGYATLGLAYAQDFGCTIPQWVKTELNAYIEDIQDPVDGDANDGGSWYECPGDGIGVNILKTGNLISQMALVGDTPTTQRVIDALDYLARHWGDASGANQPPGWDGNPAQYQVMFCAMKGLEYMGVETFDSIDWYADFADRIVAQQVTTPGPTYGSWQISSGRGNPTIITAWALLTLEKTAPPPPVKQVPVDIKPTSCPNPLNTKSQGVLPVAILGTEEFDVTRVDPASVRLRIDPEAEEGAAPLRWAVEDVATPYEPFTGKEDCLDCITDGPDSFLDLTLKFSTQEVVALLGADVEDGDCVVLYLTGNLLGEDNGEGQAIIGEDVVRIILKKGGKK